MLLLPLAFAGPVSLVRAPVVGTHAVYAMRAALDLGDKGQATYTGTYDETVKSVEKETVTTAVSTTVTVTAMAVVRQGRPVTSERVERLDGTVTTLAKVDDVVLFATPRVDRLRSPYLPASPVEIGACWWHTEGKSDAAKAPPFSSYLKLEGEEKVGARDTWRISLDANEVDDEHPTHVKAMIWVDKADGTLERGQWAIDNFTYSATAPTSKAKLELSRTD